jgi:hypothetical protein
MTVTRRIPRESTEWVEVDVTVTADGQPVTDPVEFALVPRYTRPTSGDWFAPVADPDGSGKVGIQLDPVTSYGRFGIWVRVTDTPEVPVLEPSDVGWITRT